MRLSIVEGAQGDSPHDVLLLAFPAQATFNTEHGFTAQFAAVWGLDFSASTGRWFDDVMLLFRALKVVSSNTQAAPGGGGTPLQQPPPPFCA